MNDGAPSTIQRDLWVGASCSLLVHVVVAAVIVASIASPDDEPIEEPDDGESVEVQLDDEQPPVLDPRVEEPVPDDEVPDEPPVDEEDDPRDEDQRREEEKEEHQEDEEEKEEDEQDDELEQPSERIAVEQVTDGEEPDEADHISDEAHRTDEETVAETTTLEDVDPTQDPEATDQEAETEREMAMETPDEPIEEPEIVDPTDVEDLDESPEDEAEEVAEDQEVDQQEEGDPEDHAEREERAEHQREWRDAEQMFVQRPEDPEAPEAAEEAEDFDREAAFGRDHARHREVFDTEDLEETGGREAGEQAGRRLLANWRDNEEQMRAALENFVPNVQPGNHTSVNAKQADHASYIARMHRTIHANWGHGFLVRISNNFSSRHPLNDRSLHTVVEIVLDGETGDLEDVARVEPSGNEMFDGAALQVAQNVGDQPEPPDAMVSPDGNVYIHWSFWRDERQCGTFGVRIYRLQDEDERRSVGGP